MQDLKWSTKVAKSCANLLISQGYNAALMLANFLQN